MKTHEVQRFFRIALCLPEFHSRRKTRIAAMRPGSFSQIDPHLAIDMELVEEIDHTGAPARAACIAATF